MHIIVIPYSMDVKKLLNMHKGIIANTTTVYYKICLIVISLSYLKI